METSASAMLQPQDLESSVKLPYVLKDRILMSPGTWHASNCPYPLTYTHQELLNGYNATNWNKRENTSLFYDHIDTGVREWIGEISNPRMDSTGNLVGDIVIVNKQAAINLAYGAHFGISPKIRGKEISGQVMNLSYHNFSLVYAPACTTTYINNSQAKSEEMSYAPILIEEELAAVTDMEAKRKEMGMSVGEFYACPRDPPSDSKLPIFDASHARNAMARFNQTEGMSAEEKATAKKKIASAAKKFGIEMTMEMMEETKMEDNKETISQKLEQAKPAEPAKQEQAPPKEDVLALALKEISSKIDVIMPKLDGLTAKQTEHEKALLKLGERKNLEEEQKKQEPKQIEAKMEIPNAPEKSAKQDAVPDKLGAKASPQSAPTGGLTKLPTPEEQKILNAQFGVMMYNKQKKGGL